ncbi:AAA family ATPase [Echinicola sp. CAU 1574]|uniref:Oxygen sensor histidine kinase NreB n=1 Tax=Echinicola arenosa TaxID=2774144 RepID=A0ABR9AJ96_9BACT|nr:AAA family ATPase [Echinicola arenosa]MBD8487923.1 AAA family ATPase [Echinicola arenosa]
MKDASPISNYISPSNKKFISQLNGYAERILSGKDERLCGILLKGPIGTGKTYLVEQFLHQNRPNYLVLDLKHNQQQSNIPYVGFKMGIADFLRKIYKQMDKAAFSEFSKELKTQLGAHLPLLFDYIPELSLLAGKSPEPNASPVPKVENQLYTLFRIFFEFLSDFFQKPVLLFSDDLQWADGSGMNLLYYLILHLPSHKFLWIGASRESAENMFRVNQLIESLNYDKKHLEIVSLKGLDQNQTEYFLEEILGNSTTRELTQICYELSEGNPSYLQVLVESLKNTDLIYFENQHWKGKLEKIKQQYQGRDSQNILWSKLEKLSEPSLQMLSIVSCMGNFKNDILLSLFSQNEHSLEQAIQEALDAGLIEIHENTFRFAETHIGEVIYEGIPLGQKKEIHYKLGKQIISDSTGNINSTQKVIAAQHFNQAIELVKQNEDSLKCAELNLEAGKIQLKDQAFEQARHFLKTSADLFGELPREMVKDRMWETFMERAKVEYHLGEYDLAEIHLDNLLERLLDPIKRAETFIPKITINNHLGRYRKVVTILREILSELGLDLPHDELAFQLEIDRLSQLIDQTDLMDSPAIINTPPNIQNVILRLLYVGGMALHHTSDIMMTWAALQIIYRSKGSQEPGVKAIGYVSYGRMSIISGHIKKGYELGIQGLQVNQELNDLQYRCRVYGVFAFYIQPWKKEFKASTPLLHEGMKAGRTSGDLIGLYILKTHLFNLHLISGQPIKALLNFEFEESYPGMELTYYITHYQKSLIKYLTGDSPFFSIPRQQPSWLAAKLTIQEERFYRNHVWARFYFMFGHFEHSLRCAREAHQNRKLQEGSPLVPANLTLLFLSISQSWNPQNEESRNYLLEELQSILDLMDQWQTHAPDNYKSTYLLMQAEWSRINNSPQSAIKENFHQAIASAQGNFYESALSHELYAKFCLEQSDLVNGKSQLEKAILAFRNWEGVTKANQIIQQYQFLFQDDSFTPVTPDVETLLRELSGDLESQPLTQKLMVMLLRISGSTQTAIEWIENNGEVIEVAKLSLLPRNGALNENHLVPSGLMLMAHRSQSSVIINDLEKENSFSEINTLRKQGVQSLMILPININGYLSMVVYLENNFVKNLYQDQLIKWIRIVANQGGMIIENARTHEKTLRLNEEIRKEMEEKQRLSSLIEAQKNNHLKDLIQTQEDERKRIAGDLHDSLGSLLSTIKMRLNRIQEDLSTNTPQLLYRETMDKMDEAIDEVRRIAHNMSPVSLRRFGLASALQTLVEQVNLGGKLEGHLQILGLEDRLPEQIELTIYRICQELVHNTVKHAHASNLYLQLINHEDSLNITVEDNGLGMDKEKVATGLGLHGIEAKVQMLNGQFDIESQPGKGFLAVIDIPINTP